MRLAAIFVLSIMIFGCFDLGDRGNVTNVSENVTQPSYNETASNDTVRENQTEIKPPEPPRWTRHTTPSFSFDYPINMETQEASGIFTGIHNLDGQTGEILIVTYINTSAVYGPNKDGIFQEYPSEAASDLLREDMADDPAEMLDAASYVGEPTTYAIVRDGFVSDVPFTIRFSETGKLYQGHALSIYVPERSLHVKVRVVALNSDLADEIKEQFLLGLRIE